MVATEHDEQLPRRRSDGEQTHAAILDAAMRLASIEGLASLTIGRLARELGISKSGVFAHFRSKERLQQETVDAASDIFEREVLEPGLAAPEGLAQIEGLCEAYLSYIERGVFPGGCFFAQLLAEYDAQSGPLHEQLAAGQRGWLGLLERLIVTAQQHGELHPSADPPQLANYWSVLYRDAVFVEHGRAAVRATLSRATPGSTGPSARRSR